MFGFNFPEATKTSFPEEMLNYEHSGIVTTPIARDDLQTQEKYRKNARNYFQMNPLLKAFGLHKAKPGDKVYDVVEAEIGE